MADEIDKIIEEQERQDEKYVTRNEDGRVTVLLEMPVELKAGNTTRTIEEINLRRSKGKDWAATDRADGQIGKTLLLAASVSGEPRAVFEEMDGDDFLRVMRIVGSMGKSQAGGETSSET